jgi:hypothetical protein
MIGTLNWVAVGSLAAVLLVALGVFHSSTLAMRRWYDRLSKEEDVTANVTLYGREAKGPYPEIVGLVKSHSALDKFVRSDMAPRLEAVEQGIGVLLARTSENGGDSMRDQMNRIDRYVREQGEKE